MFILAVACLLGLKVNPKECAFPSVMENIKVFELNNFALKSVSVVSHPFSHCLETLFSFLPVVGMMWFPHK